MFRPEDNFPSGDFEYGTDPSGDQSQYKLPPERNPDGYQKGDRFQSSQEFEDIEDLKELEGKAERDIKIFMDSIFAIDNNFDLGKYKDLKKYIRRLIESGDPIYEKRGHILADQLNTFLGDHPEVESKYKTMPLSDTSEDTASLRANKTNRLDASELANKQTGKL